MDTKRSTSTEVTCEAPTTSTQSQEQNSEHSRRSLKSDGQQNEVTLPTSEKKQPSTELRSVMSYRQWTMISAGPSMVKVTASDILKGPVVAINRAISIRHRVPVNIWAVWDHPDRLFGLGYDKYIYPPLQVWLGPNRFQECYLSALGRVEEPEWEGVFDPEIGFRCLPFGFRENLDGKDKTVFTLIYAIEKAVSMGARKIKVLGADMIGSWAPGKSEEECVKDYGERWSWERWQFSEMVKAAETAGVEVTKG